MQNEKKASGLKTLFTALFVMVLWAVLYPLVKIGYSVFCIAVDDIPSIIVFAGTRFTLCGALILLFTSLKGRRVELPSKREMLFILAGALTVIILQYGFTYIGLALGEGSKGAIIKQVGFLFLSGFAFLFDKSDKFSWRKLIAGLLGFCGIIVISLDGSGFSFALGDALLLLSSFCACIGAVVGKRATQTIPTVKYTGYTQLVGGAVLLATGLLLGGRIWHVDLFALLIFALTCSISICGYLLWNGLLKSAKISKLSIIKFTEPLLAVVFSWLLLGEDIWKVTYLAALLVMVVAILIEQLHTKKQ